MRFLSAIFILLISPGGFAATLPDVRVLGFNRGANGVEVKFQTADGPRNSYFTVNIVQDDPGAFAKLAAVTEKLVNRDNYQLNLEIHNFSASPPGSYYRSPSVLFSGSQRQPSSVPPKLKKK